MITIARAVSYCRRSNTFHCARLHPVSCDRAATREILYASRQLFSCWMATVMSGGYLLPTTYHLPPI